jgi:hypothetical protein
VKRLAIKAMTSLLNSLLLIGVLRLAAPATLALDARAASRLTVQSTMIVPRQQ